VLYRMLPLLLACTLVLLTGCATKNAGHDGAELTAATAKAALVEMLEQTDDGDLRSYLELLKSTEPKTEDDGSIVKFGPFACFIPKQRFVLIIISADDHGFIEWSGSFVQTGGKWTAEVERKSRT
jgi:hypothetical protein